MRHRRLCAGEKLILDKEVLAYIQARVPHSVRFYEMVTSVHYDTQQDVPGSYQDYYAWCSTAVQRLKRADHIQYDASLPGWRAT